MSTRLSNIMTEVGMALVKFVRKVFQRRLVPTLIGVVTLYSLFFLSQYITINNNNAITNMNKRDSLASHPEDVRKDKSDLMFVEPTSWGNISDLKAEVIPLLMDYVKLMRNKGSRNIFKVTWDDPQVDIQNEACVPPVIPYPRAKVTIIIHLHGKRIDKVLTSLFQLLALTDVRLVEDVILVGDESLPLSYQDIYDLFPDYIPSFRVFVIPKRTTVTQARKYASKFAHGKILLFLDALVIVTKQWLEHILEAIFKNPKQIIQPVIVKIDSPYEKVLKPNLITRREIELDLTLVEKHHRATVHSYKNSVVRDSITNPSVFAIFKELYEGIRGLDDYSGLSDIEMIVFSLKSWLCGNGVGIVPCSNVILQSNTDVLSPVHSPQLSQLMSMKRSRHLGFITSLWFSPYDEAFKCLVTKAPKPRQTYIEKRTIRLYKVFYGTLGCNRFSRFINLAQPNFPKPKTNTTGFGYLSLKGHDFFLTGFGNGSVGFVKDLPSRSPPFTYGNFFLSVNNRCVTCLPDLTLTLEACDVRNVDQKWLFSSGKFYLQRQPLLCIIKDQNNSYPTINVCRNRYVKTEFEFSYNFVENCIK